LATHWLDELAKLLQAWRQIRFPSPDVTPETKPDNPSIIDPSVDLRPIRNCEGAFVTPVANTSKTLH
jgi:hypothetical protein